MKFKKLAKLTQTKYGRNMNSLVACQIACLVILPRGTKPRGETLHIAIFGYCNLSQLDAQDVPSALRVSRQKADALRAAGPPGSPPRIQKFASLAIEKRNELQIVGDAHAGALHAPATWLRKTEPGGSGRMPSAQSIIEHSDPILWFRPRITSVLCEEKLPLWLHEVGKCLESGLGCPPVHCKVISGFWEGFSHPHSC